MYGQMCIRDSYNDTAFAVRHFKRSVSDFTRFFSEDSSQQSFFCGKIRLPFGGNFANQDVITAHFSAYSYYAVSVQIFERIFADIRYFPCLLYTSCMARLR